MVGSVLLSRVLQKLFCQNLRGSRISYCFGALASGLDNFGVAMAALPFQQIPQTLLQVLPRGQQKCQGWVAQLGGSDPTKSPVVSSKIDPLHAAADVSVPTDLSAVGATEDPPVALHMPTEAGYHIL